MLSQAALCHWRSFNQIVFSFQYCSIWNCQESCPGTRDFFSPQLLNTNGHSTCRFCITNKLRKRPLLAVTFTSAWLFNSLTKLEWGSSVLVWDPVYLLLNQVKWDIKFSKHFFIRMWPKFRILASSGRYFEFQALKTCLHRRKCRNCNQNHVYVTGLWNLWQ